jgi:hypothetical protein
MFSPIGKKKQLLQHKFGGGSPPSSKPGSPTHALSPSKRAATPTGNLEDTQNLRELRQKLSLQAPTSAIASTNRLEDALSDVGLLGVVIKKIMEGTARYRPERDSVLLKAFESRTIDYTLFRQYLNTAFWLTFTNDEFQVLVQYFDPTGAGILDGYSFMKAFVRLSAIRKERESTVVREKQDTFERTQKEEEERKKLEKLKRLESGVDYNFTAEVKKSALEKLQTAAKKFDPAHPASPSLAAFNVSHLKPLEFR